MTTSQASRLASAGQDNSGKAAEWSGATGAPGWTTLRFQDPGVVVRGLTPGVDATLTFVIENHLGHDEMYEWSATVVTDGGSSTDLTGVVSVGADRTAPVEVELPADEVVADGRVVIELDSAHRIDIRIRDRG